MASQKRKSLEDYLYFVVSINNCCKFIYYNMEIQNGFCVWYFLSEVRIQ